MKKSHDKSHFEENAEWLSVNEVHSLAKYIQTIFISSFLSFSLSFLYLPHLL